MLNSRKASVTLFAIALLFFGGCWDGGASHSQADLEQHFREEFGFQPPAEVKGLRCEWSFIRDDLEKWISFDAPEMVFQRLRENGFVAVNIEQDQGFMKVPSPSDINVTNPNAPKWWKSPSRASVTELFYRNRSSDTRTSFIYFWRDRTTGTIYAHSVVIN